MNSRTYELHLEDTISDYEKISEIKDNLMNIKTLKTIMKEWSAKRRKAIIIHVRSRATCTYAELVERISR